MIMWRLIRIATIGMSFGVIAGPALAQSYGYDAPAPAYGAPPAGAYGSPPPVAYGAPPSRPGYGQPPGSRCEASFEGEYRRRRFVCPMRIAKPVGASCRCVAAPRVPGDPPGPVARGRVIP